ncbi:MAG: hypothetical protein ABI564_18655 [Ideonella sp.]
MAKPNYSFEKRQREMAKKKKKEEKLRDKADRKVGGDSPSDDGSAADNGEPAMTQAPAGPATPT